MYLAPLLGRELHVAVRRRSTYRLRSLCGGAAMGVAAWSFLVWGASPFVTGLLFYVLCGMVEAITVFSGYVRALDAIAQERRDGTLPLLFLTDLRAIDVVVGKVAAAALTPMLSLLASLPALGVFQLVGGVPVDLLWRVAVALATTLLFAVAVTVFVSSVTDQRSSTSLVAALLLLVLNPVRMLIAAVSDGAAFWWWFVLYAVLTGGFMIATGVMLEKTWRKEVSQKGDLKQQARWAAKLARFAREKQPITWIMLRRWRSRLDSRLVLELVMAVGTVGIGALIWKPGRADTALLILFGLHLLVIFALLGRTSFGFVNDHQEGSLEILLCTPLTDEEIFSGFSGFLQAHFARLLLIAGICDAVVAGLLVQKGRYALVAFPVTMGLVLWMTFMAARWLGVYRSLMSAKPLFAAGATFLRIAFLPMLLSAAFLYAPKTDYTKVCIFWTAATGFLAIFFATDSRRVLVERGRELMLRPPSDKPPHIESEWSFINWEELEETRPALENA